MGDVTGHDDGSVKAKTRGDRVLAEELADLAHRLVEVNDHAFSLTGLTQGLRNPLCRVIIQLFDPDTVLVDLCLDVAVCRTAYPKADRAARAVARQTYDADVVGEIFSSELCSETDLVGLLKHLLLKFHVTESPSGLIAGRRQSVIVVRGSQLDCQKVLLSRCATNHECDVVWRTGSRSESLHLLHEERHESTRIENCLGHLIEVGLVGRAATLHAQEAQSHVFVIVGSLRIAKDLGDLLVVGRSQKEIHIPESGVRKHRKSLRSHLENRMTLELTKGHALACQLVVLGCVRSQLEHRSIFEFCHINEIFLVIISLCLQSEPSRRRNLPASGSAS